MAPAPIALFTYNRPEHARRTLEALVRNDLARESDLYVFSDGPRSQEDEAQVDAVRLMLREVKGFRSVVVEERPANAGLAASIITGVTQLCDSHDRVVVVEDDLVTSPHFLRFMNDGLDLYADDPEVAVVCGYVYPLRRTMTKPFFLSHADSCGWATWSRAWETFDPDAQHLLTELEDRNLAERFDMGHGGFMEMLRMQARGEIDSWAVRWYASMFLRGRLSLFPGTSLVQNIGFDGSGRHSGTSDRYEVALVNQPIALEREELVEDPEARRQYERFFADLSRWPRLAAAVPGAKPAVRALRRVRRAAERSLRAVGARGSIYLKRVALPSPTGPTVRLGTDYGGWHIPASGLAPRSVVYSGGVGEDASFDLELIERFDVDVWAFDPTPRAIEFAGSITDPRFTFMPIGLWSGDGEQVFFPPSDATHVSHSIGNLQRSSAPSFRAPVRTIPSLMRELGHDHIDLLKLDIEGAELQVLRAVTDGVVIPRVVAVEFHPSSIVDTARVVTLVRSLLRRGYRLVALDEWDLTFSL